MQSAETLSAIVSILLQTGLFSFYIGFGAIDPCQIAHIYSVSLHWRRIDAMHLQFSASHRWPGQVSTDRHYVLMLRAGAAKQEPTGI